MTQDSTLTLRDEIIALCDAKQDAEDREDYATSGRLAQRIAALRAELAAMPIPAPPPEVVQYAIEVQDDRYRARADGSLYTGPCQEPWRRIDDSLYPTSWQAFCALTSAKAALPKVGAGEIHPGLRMVEVAS